MNVRYHAKLKPVPRLSLEDERQTVLDELDAILLRRISETSSLTEAAKLLGISYRNAWGRVKKIQSSTGKQILETKVGGTTGGSSKLTADGMTLLREFRSVRKYLFNVLDDRVSAGNVSYKLSARNRIKAKITKIEKGNITSSIKMDVIAPSRLTSIITNEAVEDLGLKEGDEVEAVIKSTEVMIAKETPPPIGRRRKTPH